MDRRRIISSLLFTLLFLTLGMLIHKTTVAINTSLSTATVYVDPHISTGTTGQNFTINVNISDVTNLYGWEFKLGWNATILEAVDVGEGSFLKRGGSTFFTFKMNNTEGYTLVDGALLGDVSGVNGNGTLATIQFTAKDNGECVLDLYDTILVDSEEVSIEHAVIDGYYSTGGWKISFIGLGGYPIVDFAVYNGNLYAVSDSTLYMYNGSCWNITDAPTSVLSLVPYEDKLIVGGKGGLYSYDGITFTLIFTVPTYIKPLGIYNNVLYAGTVLDKPPTLYYCNGSAENPANWHVDTGFSTVLNFSGIFGSIDSFAVYNNKTYVASGGTVYSYNGTNWNITKTYDDVCAFLDMKVHGGKLYLATRDQAWRKPCYLGYSGFSGRVIEFDGDYWATVFDHDYWIYSLETFNGKLYVGAANKIYTYDGTDWNVSFNDEEEAYYAISFITFNDKIYVGMGNGYILEDPSSQNLNSETLAVPEFPSTTVLLIALMFVTFPIIAGKKEPEK